MARHKRCYPGRPDQVREVRAFVRNALADCPRVDDAVLVVSELATNSVLHSRSGVPGGVFTVSAEVRPGIWICLEVKDQGGTWTFQPSEVRTGHGLDLVRAIAGPGNWGVDGSPSGRLVWARLLWPESGLTTTAVATARRLGFASGAPGA